MDPQDAIDLGREAIKACFLVGGPILLASLVIGLLVGVLQAMTQVQDQTVSFVPKLICLMLVIGVCLPWLTDKMVDFSRETLTTPMTHFHVTAPIRPTSHARIVKTSSRTTNIQASLPAEIQRHISTPTDESMTPSKPPFQLPHYRYSKLPSENIGG